MCLPHPFHVFGCTLHMTGESPDKLVRHSSFGGPHSSRPRNLASTPGHSSGALRQRNDISKALLMNGYPLAYVLLWLPAQIRAATDAAGHTPHWINLLQWTPHFIGIANALTYGYNENIKREIKQFLASRRPRPSTV